MSKAFVFPAFITNYTGKELSFLSDNGIGVRKYLDVASEVLGKELPAFDYTEEIYQKDELLSQFIAYIFACSINDALNLKKIFPKYVAGYSMGIYAALYASKAIDFKTGLEIILKAFNTVKEIGKEGTYGMGSTIGLTTDDIHSIISKNILDIEIININNSHSIVSAGRKEDIKKFVEIAIEEGAMSANELIVNVPYHSKYLTKYSGSFKAIIDSVSINHAKYPLISTYNHKECVTSIDLKQDLLFNLTERINWYKTMQSMLSLGVNEVIETGAGKDLSKMARFIEGNYAMKSIYKI